MVAAADCDSKITKMTVRLGDNCAPQRKQKKINLNHKFTYFESATPNKCCPVGANSFHQFKIQSEWSMLN